MRGSIHRAEQHRSFIPSCEAFTLATDRSFPRHAHDSFGVGVLHAGAHRSWSGIGRVEAFAGDVITVNPGEIHDGDPVRGAVRSWRMLYLDPCLVAQALREDLLGEAQIARPVLHDPLLAIRCDRLFVALTEPVPDIFAAEQALLRLLASFWAVMAAAPSRFPARRRPWRVPSNACARALNGRPRWPIWPPYPG